MAPKTLNITFAADSSQVGQAFSKIESQSSSFGEKLTKVGAGLTAAVTLPLVGFAAKAVSEASEARVVLGQTEAVIKSTGAAANVTAGQVTNMADKLGNLAGVEGEVVQESSNLLLTFTNVRNETGKNNDVFNQAQKAILDMGVAMNNGKTEGLDLQAATIQVGKALNDPIKGMTALSKVGVTFTEQQKKQVEAMVASGDTMGAQKLILAELQKEFGGSAEAAGKNLPPLERLQLAFANMAESIGTLILPFVDRFAKAVAGLAERFQGLSPEAQKMALVFGGIAATVGPLLLVVGKLMTGFKAVKVALAALSFNPIVIGVGLAIGALVLLWKHSEGFRNAVQNVVATVVSAWNAFKNAFQGFEPDESGGIIGWFAKLGDRAGYWIGEVRNVFKWLSDMWNRPDITSDGWFGKIEQFVGWLRSTFDSLVGWWQGIWPQFSEAVGHVFNVISGIISGYIAVISAIWRVWGDDLLTVLKGVWDAIYGVVSGVIQVIAGIIKTVLAVINGDWGRAWEGIKQIFGGVWEAIKAILSGALNIIKGVIGGAWDTVRAITGAAWDRIKSAVSSGIETVVGFVRGIPGRVVSAIGNLGSTLYNAGRSLLEGLLNGIKAAWNAVASFLSGLASKIRSLKGPIEKDRKLLVPEGMAIMEGFEEGLRRRWGPVAGFLSSVGDGISVGSDISGSIAPRAGGMQSASASTGPIILQVDGRTLGEIVDQVLADRLRANPHLLLQTR